MNPTKDEVNDALTRLDRALTPAPVLAARLLLLLALLVVVTGACEDQQLKRAKTETEVWKTQARLWEQTAGAWEAQAGVAVAAAKQAQAIAGECLNRQEKRRQ